MNKSIKYLNNKLYFTYDITQEHLETLFLINANDNCAEFENRDIEHLEDLDGNAITWKTCDELVETGLLVEDEEAFSIFYELTDDGKEVIRQVALEH